MELPKYSLGTNREWSYSNTHLAHKLKLSFLKNKKKNIRKKYPKLQLSFYWYKGMNN